MLNQILNRAATGGKQNSLQIGIASVINGGLVEKNGRASPKRATFALAGASQNSMERAFSPCFQGWHTNLGLRPRLVWGRTFGPQNRIQISILSAESAASYQPAAKPQVLHPATGAEG